ncbi:MAG: hypothetical protein DELT_02578 [Desulfovibrio sp.]
MIHSFIDLVDPLRHMPLSYEPDVDLFAGGGGASTGFEQAFGKSPDIAINHDAEALAMHRANHPGTIHFCQNIINVHPLQATGGRLVRALWASPDCTHFSKAKGGKPRNQNIRDLAWTVVRWAEHARPKLIGIENVEEFKTWGPLDAEGQPIKERAGETFKVWLRALKRFGYSIDFKELRACDCGAPTTRKRLFIIARLDGKRVRWPKPTHGAPDSPEVKAGKLLPWRTVAECIDWTDPAPSIFDRKKPLAENTQRRIAEGIRRYVMGAKRPFLVTYYGPKTPGEFRGLCVDEPLRTQGTENKFGFVSPYLVNPNHTASYYQYFRGQEADTPLGTVTAAPGHALVAANMICIDHKGAKGRFNAACSDVSAPLSTVTGENRHALVAANLVKMRGTNIGGPVDSPLQTISAQGLHHGVVAASIVKYYGEGGQHAGVDEPLHTATAKARFGLSAAHLCQFNGSSTARAVNDPLPTTCSRDKFGLVQLMLQTVDERLFARYEKVREFLIQWGVIGQDDEAVVVIDGVVLFITDIGLRMLRPRELFRANGFPESYIIDPIHNGKPLTKTSQVKKCGNSVPPPFARENLLANKDALDYVRDFTRGMALPLFAEAMA